MKHRYLNPVNCQERPQRSIRKVRRDRFVAGVLRSVKNVIHHLENDEITDITVTSTFMELIEKWFESDTKIKQLNKKLFGSIVQLNQ